jgi:tetratricopeptide (TPR) repeat protein
MELSYNQNESNNNRIIFSSRSNIHSGLSAAFEICDQIAKLSDHKISEKLGEITYKIKSTLPQPESGITYAIERRISRENIVLAISIEHLASWLISALNKLGIDSYVVTNLAAFDDLSLKLLARVVPFTNGKWTLLYGGEVLEDRALLLNRFSSTTGVIIHDTCNTFESVRNEPAEHRYYLDIKALARELVLTNYSTCITVGKAMIACVGFAYDSKSEVLRLLALAYLNRGLFHEALTALSDAETDSQSLLRKAHLACLQSLIAQKRIYDVSVADSHIKRGLSYLENSADFGVSPETIDLERSWLLNSEALSMAIRYRKTLSSEAWLQAMTLLRKAFDIAKRYRTPAFLYLKYNLTSNTVFLLEMKQEYNLALSLLEQSFNNILLSKQVNSHSIFENYTYRKAILKAKMGFTCEALSILDGLVPVFSNMSAWFLSERVLRASTSIAARAGLYIKACDYATQGLEIVKKHKSMTGIEFHYKNLNCLISKSSNILIDQIPYPAPKLPAYIPEIDLEEVPALDMNKFLVSSTKEVA